MTRSPFTRGTLAAASFALAAGFAAVPMSIDVSGSGAALKESAAFARRGADDPAGHVRQGRGADDPAGHVRKGRGADDPAGDDKGGARSRSSDNSRSDDHGRDHGGDDHGGRNGGDDHGGNSGRGGGDD